MKVKLEVTKAGERLHEGTYEVDDHVSFGTACAEIWTRLHERCMASATSIGDLMDTINESVIDELNGAQITLKKP
jgi:hypothetical protein